MLAWKHKQAETFQSVPGQADSRSLSPLLCLITVLGRLQSFGWVVGSSGQNGKFLRDRWQVASRSGPNLLPVMLGCDKSIWGCESGLKADREGAGRGLFPLTPSRELAGDLANSSHGNVVARLRGVESVVSGGG